MFVLTENGVLICLHTRGIVNDKASQNWVRIAQSPVQVDSDPESKSIGGCPNIGVGIKPCTTTLKVEKGYSTWIKIGGRSICLDTVTGLTDGTPPGVVHYIVREPGQVFVSEK
jgi:hypothetical protein